MSGIIANVTGMSTAEFAQEYLFTPLGISENETYWWTDEKGMNYGGYAFDCSPKVQAKIGILALNNGNWNGVQLVDLNFMKSATKSQVFEGWNNYGYLWWILDRFSVPFKGFAAIGAGGQNIYVIPEYDIVVGFTASLTSYVDYETLISDYILQFVDNSAPEWDEIPENQTILEGESFFYDVNASHTLGVEYSINDTVNFNITPEGIITNSLNLSVGVYPLEIRVFNPYNKSLTTTINLIVEPKPSSNVIPGFDLNMIFFVIICTTAVLMISRKKIPK